MKTRVLIIDDHPSLRLALKAIFGQDPSIEVVGEAATADEGLKFLAKDVPDVVILDLMLPDLSGLDVIAKIKHKELDCKILVFSAQSTEIYLEKIVAAGANGFISKNCTPDEIFSTFKAVVAGFNCFPSFGIQPITSSANQQRPLNLLSQRELTVLIALAQGLSNKDVANKLHLSEKTVSTYKFRIQTKLGVNGVVAMANYARENGLL